MFSVTPRMVNPFQVFGLFFPDTSDESIPIAVGASWNVFSDFFSCQAGDQTWALRLPM